MKPFITMAAVAVALFNLVTYPALAEVGTNPASGNPYDYSGAGDWLGSAGDDQFTNNAGATVNGDVDMTQGGTDTFINNGTVTGDYLGASSNGNRITNSGVITNIEGSLNGLNYSSGGSNTIYNHGTTFSIYGSYNSGDNSSGGSNTIYNNNTVTFAIYGSYNSGDNSSGGSNTIYNHGTTFSIYGSRNSGDYSSGGSNRIYNYGIAEQIFGEVTGGFNSSGGTTVIYNYSTVTGDIYGASNASATGGGSRTIYNYGTVGDDIYGNYNRSVNATGGSNTIYNYGTVGNSGPGDNNIYGSCNAQPNTSGGDNTIYNYGSVQDNIYGSLNEGDNSSGGGNTITNSGTVGGSIYGTLNSGAGASSGGAGNTITNSGTVGGGIYAGDADDTVYILSGSNVSGVVDGQAGTDSLYFGAAGTMDSSNLAAKYQNFENLGLYVDGNTSLTGNWVFNLGATITETGTFTLNSTLNGTTLNNAGTVTLNGDTTFSGAVTNSGGLTVGSGSSLTAASVNNSDSLAVDGTLTADSLTNSGGMAIGGSVDVGTLNNDGGGLGVAGSLTADNLINSGGVGIGGTVTVGSLVNSGAIGVGTTLTAGSVTNSGNLAVGGTMTAGSVSNSGNLAVGGTMTADSIYNSGDLPVGGTLTAGSVTNSGFLPVGGTMSAGSVSNSGTFDVNGSVSTGSLDNSGDLDVTVGGTLVAGSLSNTGNASITGSAFVSGATTNSGGLNVNGTLTSASFYNSGTISGSGTIHAAVTNTGTISPGNSIGTLTVASSLTFESGSVLAAELACDCSCDMVSASGAVAIKGGTISTRLPQALYTDGTSWKIITANGGISGMFDGIDDHTGSAVLSLSQYNSGDTLNLVLSRKSYGDFAGGGAADTGRSLDALVPLATGDMAMLLTAMDFNMDAQQIESVLNALNPEMYTAFSAASLKAGGLFDGAMGRRLEELRQRRAYSLDQRQALSGLVQIASAETVPLGPIEQGASSSGWSLWGRGIGLWADQDAADGYLGRGQTTGGAALGADYVVSDWLALGLATGATRTDLSWSRGNYGGDINAVHSGFYAQAGYEGFFARLLASYARLQNSATRPVNLEGYNVTARADFDADLYAAGMAVGYQAHYSQWLLEPLASLDYQHLSEDGFSEGGAGFLDLDVADRDTDSLLFNLGIRATRLIQADGWELLPRLGIAWQHQLGDDRPSLDASFAGYGSAPFTVNGADFISDVAVAEFGFTASMNSGLELFIDYRLAFADDYLAQVLGAGVMYSF